MGYHRKNKRRFDARYFLNERIEAKEQNIENSVQQEKLKSNNFSFDAFSSWNKEEIQESSCASHNRDEDEELEESNCASHDRDDDEKGLEEADCKPDFLDKDKDGNKSECWPKDSLEEIHPHAHAVENPTYSTVPDEDPDQKKPRIEIEGAEIEMPDNSQKSIDAMLALIDAYSAAKIQIIGASDHEWLQKALVKKGNFEENLQKEG